MNGTSGIVLNYPCQHIQLNNNRNKKNPKRKAPKKNITKEKLIPEEQKTRNYLYMSNKYFFVII